METASIIIPVYNKIATTLECIRRIREQNSLTQWPRHPGGGYEIVVADNASTDDTERAVRALEGIVYIRNDENLGVAAALNAGAGAAKGGVFVFMHNDVFVEKAGWIAEFHRFLVERTGAGVTGLYGAKTLRRDASFRGKSIVHCKDGPPAIRPFASGAAGVTVATAVAVVDGLLMAVRREVFHAVRGFNEDFPIHHYDKDFSMRAAAAGLINHVLCIPFKHPCATTRRDVAGEDDVRERDRLRFIALWDKSLPYDVSSWKAGLNALFRRVYPVNNVKKILTL
jgi:GT2 family glycosyltransferase